MSLRIVERSGQTRDRFGRYTKKLDNFRDEYLAEIARVAIDNSPVVDTGTYITSHEIGPGEIPSGTTSSQGKPRRQQREPFAQQGLANLYSDIGSLGDQTTVAHIGNTAEHASVYEDRFSTYAIIKREARSIAQRIFDIV
jgi:hypothetical protein